MSYMLETLNRGSVEDFGFVFGDVARIRLGALPAMPIDQFATYGTDAMIDIFTSQDLDSKIKAAVIGIVAFNCGRMYQSEITHIHARGRKKTPEDKFVQSVIKGFVPQIAREHGNDERDYSANPFALQDGKVNISNFYEVDVREFANFASVIVAGGMMGWTVNVVEIPESIKTSANRLMEAIKHATK